MHTATRRPVVQVGGRVYFTPAYDHQKMKPIAEQAAGG
jgi:hypothetical protein